MLKVVIFWMGMLKWRTKSLNKKTYEVFKTS